jgi:HlyD family secretion protein
MIRTLIGAFALSLAASALFAQGVPEGVSVRRGTIRQTVKITGKFAPADPAEMKLDLKRYGGALEMEMVAPHGSWVNEGDILARFKRKAYTEELEKRTRAMEAAEMAHRHYLAGAEMKRAESAERMATTVRNAARAEKRLKGWLEHEKAFRKERERLSKQSRKHSMENAREELSQLEKMYGDDELVDETEDIVLKRTRRSYASRQASLDLSERQRKYNKEWYEAEGEEDRVLRTASTLAALERTKRQAAMAAEKAALDLASKNRAIEKARTEFAEFKADGEMMVVRAPIGGLLVHNGGTFKMGSKIRNRQVFAQVVKPGALLLKGSIGEGDILLVRTGSTCTVKPKAMKEREIAGELDVDYLPTAKGAFPATIRLKDVPKALRPGMSGSASIVIAEVKDALMVPGSAVRNGKVKLVIEGGESAWREVTTGITDGKNIEIKSGIVEGDVVDPKPAD